MPKVRLQLSSREAFPASSLKGEPPADNNAEDLTFLLQEFLEEHLKQIPLQRYGRIDEIASASTFLFSPAAAYITGTTLVVDGADVSPLSLSAPA